MSGKIAMIHTTIISILLNIHNNTGLAAVIQWLERSIIDREIVGSNPCRNSKVALQNIQHLKLRVVGFTDETLKRMSPVMQWILHYNHKYIKKNKYLQSSMHMSTFVALFSFTW